MYSKGRTIFSEYKSATSIVLISEEETDSFKFVRRELLDNLEIG